MGDIESPLFEGLRCWRRWVVSAIAEGAVVTALLLTVVVGTHLPTGLKTGAWGIASLAYLATLLGLLYNLTVRVTLDDCQLVIRQGFRTRSWGFEDIAAVRVVPHRFTIRQPLVTVEFKFDKRGSFRVPGLPLPKLSQLAGLQADLQGRQA